jgi:hypothetical protein
MSASRSQSVREPDGNSTTEDVGMRPVASYKNEAGLGCSADSINLLGAHSVAATARVGFLCGPSVPAPPRLHLLGTGLGQSRGRLATSGMHRVPPEAVGQGGKRGRTARVGNGVNGRAILMRWTASLSDSCQRSPYGTSMPGAGAVHLIKIAVRSGVKVQRRLSVSTSIRSGRIDEVASLWSSLLSCRLRAVL